MTRETIRDLKAANGGYWGKHPRFPVSDWQTEVAEDDTRLGYWEWVEIQLENDPDPGPTYAVWIAEPPQWQWVHDQDFTCDDDPDGAGARASAHQYARYLRNTYPCAYVAVRPAGQQPLAVRDPDCRD